MPRSESTARDPSNTVLETLRSSFKSFHDGLPLAIGIHRAIKERCPDLDKQQLKAALKLYTGSTRYLKALAQAETRYDLDGLPAGDVTPEQRKQAKDTLRQRYEKIAARKQAEQLEQQRQENLLKLLEKFNSR